MTPSLKKLCIFSVAAGVAKTILDQSHKMEMSEIDLKLTQENAIDLHRVSIDAIDHCDVTVDKSRYRQAKRKVDQLKKDGELFDVPVMLSMLFLGLNDLALYCNDKSRIKAVEDAALNFITLFDPNIEDEDRHMQAVKDYERWVS